MQLIALPALSDNYIWMLHDGLQALVVDPGQATPVRQALSALDLRLTGILVTHHHPDHVGGVTELLPLLQGPLVGPDEALPVPVTLATTEFSWAGLAVQPMAVPGHTLGHVAYVLPEVPALSCREVTAPPGADGGSNGPSRPLLFCGDTLFSAGCGRLFEGTPAQMWASLHALNALPAHTLVCPTHEYTLANLRFAQAVEPANPSVAAHLAHCTALRAQSHPTLPTTLALERQINPFLRCDAPNVVAAALAQGASGSDALSVFTTLRSWKNHFK